MKRFSHRTFSGTLFVAVGVLLTLGTVTAAAFYPEYSTTTQTISALGAATAPPASRVAFNGSIVVAGVLVGVAAYSLHRVFNHPALTAMVALTGLGGLVAVGVFPSQTGVPHVIAAAISFGGTGLTALLAARVLRGSYRYVSVVLGALILATFVGFVTLQGATPLGIGGLERWIFSLTLVWVTTTGGYLLAPNGGATPG